MDEKWPEVCSSVPAHRRGFAGSPRLEPRTSFLELCQGELRRKRLPRTRVNKGKSKGDTRKGQSALGLDPPLTHSAPSPAGLVQTTTRHECVLPSPLIDLHPASASTCAGRVRVPGLGASCPRTQGADANARCRGRFPNCASSWCPLRYRRTARRTPVPLCSSRRTCGWVPHCSL
jgi:hypothetical protein